MRVVICLAWWKVKVAELMKRCSPWDLKLFQVLIWQDVQVIWATTVHMNAWVWILLRYSSLLTFLSTSHFSSPSLCCIIRCLARQSILFMPVSTDLQDSCRCIFHARDDFPPASLLSLINFLSLPHRLHSQSLRLQTQTVPFMSGGHNKRWEWTWQQLDRICSSPRLHGAL